MLCPAHMQIDLSMVAVICESARKQREGARGDDGLLAGVAIESNAEESRACHFAESSMMSVIGESAHEKREGARGDYFIPTTFFNGDSQKCLRPCLGHGRAHPFHERHHACRAHRRCRERIRKGGREDEFGVVLWER